MFRKRLAYIPLLNTTSGLHVYQLQLYWHTFSSYANDNNVTGNDHNNINCIITNKQF